MESSKVKVCTYYSLNDQVIKVWKGTTFYTKIMADKTFHNSLTDLYIVHIYSEMQNVFVK